MSKKKVSGFTSLLHTISEDLTTDEVDKMKDLLLMDEILTPKQLENVTTGLKIFLLLRNSEDLSPDNLSLLKGLLKTMGKVKLVNLVKDFENSHLQMTPRESSTGIVQETEFQDTATSRKEELLRNPSSAAYNRPLISSSRSNPLASASFDADETLQKHQFDFDTNPSDGGQRIAPRLNSVEVNAELHLCTLPKQIETDCCLTELRPQGSNFVEKRKGLLVVEPDESGNIADFDLIENDFVYLRQGKSHEVDSMENIQYDVTPSLCTYVASKPVTVELRRYQMELAKPSIDGLNNIICAPTGSGKTLTAGFIFQERWKLANKDGKRFRGLFIVCQRTLVQQQRKALEEFFPLDSGMLVGAVEENQLLKEVLLLPFCLIVLTAQKLVNGLEGTSVKITDFDMFIMDECHHTDLNHPYNKIMRFYQSLKRADPSQLLPMIVGLTASLGVGSGKHEKAAQEHYVNICANLDCSCITYVRDTENQRELLQFNPKPSADQIKSVPAREKDSPFYQVMTELMGNIEKEAGLIFSRPQDRGTQSYENWVVLHRNDAVQRDGLQHIIVACEALKTLNLAWMMHDQMQIKDAHEFLESRFPPEWLPRDPIPMQAMISKWYSDASEKLKDLARDERIEHCPQLHELCKLLRHLHRSHSDARGILLTRTRLSVDRLIKFLEQQTEFQGVIFPARFVGQGGSENALTQTEQENILRRFRLGSYDPTRVNLLVATDVAQEGLDMPKCNYVVRYNFVSNEIGSVQSRGRARAPNSELYLIVTGGSINEARELDNLQKEHHMQEALKIMDTVDKMQLKKDIADLQERNWLEHQNQLDRQQARSSAVDYNLVTIHCSKCKAQLCCASDLRIRGSNYICIAEDFEDRIIFRETSQRKEFVNEIHLGTIVCKAPDCSGNKLGLKIRYKQGCRMYGLVLGREGCVWRQNDQNGFMSIRQWSKVPFAISKELI